MLQLHMWVKLHPTSDLFDATLEEHSAKVTFNGDLTVTGVKTAHLACMFEAMAILQLASSQMLSVNVYQRCYSIVYTCGGAIMMVGRIWCFLVAGFCLYCGLFSSYGHCCHHAPVNDMPY